jgi:hypothetical protein
MVPAMRPQHPRFVIHHGNELRDRFPAFCDDQLEPMFCDLIQQGKALGFEFSSGNILHTIVMYHGHLRAATFF